MKTKKPKKIRTLAQILRSKFNWIEALEACLREKDPPFSSTSISILRARSNCWTTCACGEYCSKIARAKGTNVPKDYRLRDLGYEFNLAVRDWDWRTAISLIHKIDRRHAIVLREMKRKKI